MPYELNFEKKNKEKKYRPSSLPRSAHREKEWGISLGCYLLVILSKKEDLCNSHVEPPPPMVGINDILHKYGVSYPFE